ncbi:BTB/POZ domain-containing protein At2g46260-like [Musa acuminata AAA Group]|uniref:BTB/POZ domain-containing protein At2g46260-like n=1 Tax=Musa acuminata AAA Group TaxID=214697 RepID=UPI0031DE9E4F
MATTQLCSLCALSILPLVSIKLIDPTEKVKLMLKVGWTVEWSPDDVMLNYRVTAEGEEVITSINRNFKFAFNCPNFSDRVLRIEVVGKPPEGEVSIERNTHQKRQSDDDITEKGDDSDLVLRVNSIYVNSAILAVRSPFFFKLFTTGMKESHQQRHVTLRINTSEEEAALMELVSFMYYKKLSSTSPALLVDVLIAADKFEVASCVWYCVQRLMELPMTTKSALQYLNLPSRVSSMTPAVQYLADDAKLYLSNRNRDNTNMDSSDLEI